MWEPVFERIGMMTAATKKAYSKNPSRIEDYHMKAEVVENGVGLEGGSGVRLRTKPRPGNRAKTRDALRRVKWYPYHFLEPMSWTD